MFGIHSVADAYLTSRPSKYMDDSGGISSKLERFFVVGAYTAKLASSVQETVGNTAAAAKSDAVANGFALGRFTLGAIRVIFPLEKVLSGKVLFQRYTRSDIDAEVAKGTYKPFMVEGAFKKVATTEKGNAKEVNGEYEYVGPNEEGAYLKRNWLDVVLDVLVLAARALTPIALLHHLKAIDLGHHAKRIGMAIMGLWTAIISLGFFQTAKDLANETDPNVIREKVADNFVAFVDFLSIPFDVFDVAKGHPAACAVGAGITLLAAVAAICKDAYYYE